jgi:hypothetical protein
MSRIVSVMTCPSCGGNSRTPIAPGFYRCTSLVTTRTGGPGLTNSRIGPPVIDTTTECGQEYQEGQSSGAALTCNCGTFAIGLCAEDGKPICGTHSALFHGRRLCSDCWHAADRRRADIEAEEGEAAERSHLEARAAWKNRVLAALAGVDDKERFVRVVAGLTYDGGSGQGSTDWGSVNELLGAHPSYTLRDIANWFLSRSGGVPTSNISIEHKTLFGGFKSRQHPAWVFNQGSTSMSQFKDAPATHSDIAITPAGHIYISGPMGGWWAVEELPSPGWVIGTIGFSGHALHRMANMLTLNKIEPPPPRPATRHNRPGDFIS